MGGVFDVIYDRSCKKQCQPGSSFCFCQVAHVFTASRGLNAEHSITRSRMCYNSMQEIEKEARNNSIWFDDQAE
jgi:hypothetical protein